MPLPAGPFPPAASSPQKLPQGWLGASPRSWSERSGWERSGAGWASDWTGFLPAGLWDGGRGLPAPLPSRATSGLQRLWTPPPRGLKTHGGWAGPSDLRSGGAWGDRWADSEPMWDSRWLQKGAPRRFCKAGGRGRRMVQRGRRGSWSWEKWIGHRWPPGRVSLPPKVAAIGQGRNGARLGMPGALGRCAAQLWLKYLELEAGPLHVPHTFPGWSSPCKKMFAACNHCIAQKQPGHQW